MKITKNEGCFGSTITVDNREIADEQIKEVILRIIDKLKETELHTILNYLIEDFAEDSEDLGKCDQCGNYGARYTINLEK